jgi:hypothetical protein
MQKSKGIELYKLETKKKNKKISKKKISFECPKCHWILRLIKPDDIHPIPLSTKPLQTDNDELLIRKCVCRNPRCQKNITIYWSKPKDYYKRI